MSGAPSGYGSATPTKVTASTTPMGALAHPIDAIPSERERLSVPAAEHAPRLLAGGVARRYVPTSLHAAVGSAAMARMDLRASRSQIEAFRKVARTIKRCLESVLALLRNRLLAKGLNT